MAKFLEGEREAMAMLDAASADMHYFTIDGVGSVRHFEEVTYYMMPQFRGHDGDIQYWTHYRDCDGRSFLWKHISGRWELLHDQ